MVINIDATDISGATIDGTDVSEITIDGTVAWAASANFRLLEDFESGDLSNWSGNQKNDFSATTNNVISGSYSCESVGTWGDGMSFDNFTCKWGEAYRWDFMLTDPGQDVYLIAHGQDPANPYATCYSIWIDGGDSLLKLRKRGGSSSIYPSASFSPSANTVYTATMEVYSDEVIAYVTDQSENELARCSSSISGEFSGGVLGIRTGGETQTFTDNMQWADLVKTAVMVDSWEDQSYSEYTDYEYGGGTSEYQFNTSDAQDGSVSAELTATAGGYPSMLSTSGLNAYPEQGDKFSIWLYNSTGHANSATMNYGFYWGGQDLQNAYFVRHNVSGNSADLVVKINDSNNTLDSVTLDANGTAGDPGWYKWIVEWDDGQTFGGEAGDMNLTIQDSSGTALFSMNGTDQTFASGGVGIWGGVASGEYARWDKYQIHNR